MTNSRLSLEVFFDTLKNSDAQSLTWLREQCEKKQERHYLISFAAVPRHFSHKTLESIQHPAVCTYSEYARFALLTSFREQCNVAELHSFFRELIRCADLAELIALAKYFHFLEGQEFVLCAREFLRNNAQSVFSALACHNDFPQKELDEEAWNQLILKAFFVSEDLRNIHGAAQRQNAALGTMLMQYARERRAAGRRINPQIWQFIGPYCDGDEFELLDWLCSSENLNDQQAAALALNSCGDIRASSHAIELGLSVERLDWSKIAPDYEDTNAHKNF